MPEVQGFEGLAAAQWFHGADGEEELSVRGEARCGSLACYNGKVQRMVQGRRWNQYRPT